MLQVLVYGDSLSWGIVPGSRRRFAFDERWPGIAERGLCARGCDVRVIEDCLNGRRTVWGDPYKPGRNGVVGLAQRIEAHSPLALVAVVLGTNDFQSLHDNDAWKSGQGLAALVREIRGAPIEPGMPVPPVLIVAPPTVGPAKGAMAEKFAGAERRCRGHAAAYAKVAEELGCAFFDAGAVAGPSVVDGVHLDADQHRAIGEAMVPVMAALLPGGESPPT